MRRVRIIASLLVAGAVVLGAAPARAQPSPELRTRVDEAIRLTDSRIADAQSHLAGCQQADAVSNIQFALSLQGEAKQRFTSATVDMDLRIALDLTGRARYRAENAMRLARCCLEHDRIVAQLEHTRGLIERARERAETCGNDQARALLRTAVDQQRQAEVALSEGRCLIGLQFSLSARDKSLRALRLCGFDDRIEDRVQQFLSQTDRRLERARSAVEGARSDRAQQALDMATELQSRAYGQYRESRFEASMRLSRSARDAADRAERLARSGP